MSRTMFTMAVSMDGASDTLYPTEMTHETPSQQANGFCAKQIWQTSLY